MLPHSPTLPSSFPPHHHLSPLFATYGCILSLLGMQPPSSRSLGCTLSFLGVQPYRPPSFHFGCSLSLLGVQPPFSRTTPCLYPLPPTYGASPGCPHSTLTQKGEGGRVAPEQEMTASLFLSMH